MCNGIWGFRIVLLPIYVRVVFTIVARLFGTKRQGCGVRQG